MKVLLINGSPRENGCTYTALREAGEQLEQNGIETVLVQLGKKPTQGCIACHKCAELHRCVFDDQANEWGKILAECDGVIIGSPVYYASPNGALCAVLDRMFYCHSGSFAGKPASSIVSCRRAGSSSALDRLNKYFTISNMPVVPSQYWNMVHGNTPDEVRQDKEGMQIMRTLGKNMAWLLQNLHTAQIPPLPKETPERTNFIR